MTSIHTIISMASVLFTLSCGGKGKQNEQPTDLTSNLTLTDADSTAQNTEANVQGTSTTTESLSNGTSADADSQSSVQNPVILAQVEKVTIGNHGDSRSRVAEIAVLFDSKVTTSSNAFNLFSLDTNAIVNFQLNISEVEGKTLATLSTFTGSAVDSVDSLVDGNYWLNISPDKVIKAEGNGAGTQLDGDSSGEEGGHYRFGCNVNDNFFRLAGDADGDADVDGMDFAAHFIPANNSVSPAENYRSDLDFDQDGDIDSLDFNDYFGPAFSNTRSEFGQCPEQIMDQKLEFEDFFGPHGEGCLIGSDETTFMVEGVEFSGEQYSVASMKEGCFRTFTSNFAGIYGGITMTFPYPITRIRFETDSSSHIDGPAIWAVYSDNRTRKSFIPNEQHSVTVDFPATTTIEFRQTSGLFDFMYIDNLEFFTE